MVNRAIAYQRLQNQQLMMKSCDSPEDVVRWLGAVQAQEFPFALWGLALRLNGFNEAAVEQVFADGRILRTHVMRPTWHFVLAEDIRWMQELTAPRVHRQNGTMYRRLEVDDGVYARSRDAIVRALEGGRSLTRNEISEVLAQVGIEAKGQRLAYIMFRVELDLVVCSGPRRGKQFTYMLVDERAPHPRRLERDEALAELVRRYFTSHGPAQIKDFTWWSGLTVADAKAGLAMLKDQIAETVIDGKHYYHAASMPPVTDMPPIALLLPPFDEYTIAYKDHSVELDPANLEPAKTLLYGGAMVLNGEVVGYWHRTLKKDAVEIRFVPFRPLSDAERDALASAAGRYAEFLGLKPVIAA
ncbi:MAG: winged helix DNA-binding domain-containing protein [Chloroflexota bacterium]|nr:MAG: winged helix DNA-binding domain-containing protein [Chloroflexota bacterium]